jgi:hypothetical protein
VPKRRGSFRHLIQEVVNENDRAKRSERDHDYEDGDISVPVRKAISKYVLPVQRPFLSVANSITLFVGYE